MQHTGMWASMPNVQVQMKTAHLGTGLATFPGRCVTELAFKRGSINVFLLMCLTLGTCLESLLNQEHGDSKRAMYGK